MGKTLLVVALTLLVSTLFANDPVSAAGELQIDSTSVYSVTLEGETTVTHEIQLTNKLPNVYPTQYSLTAGSTSLTNIWAKDDEGPIQPSVHKSENSTTLEVIFNEKSVGLGQTLTFSLGYNDADVTQKVGRVWEVNIPYPEDINEYASYTIVLVVPQEFKDPIQITPQPEKQLQYKGVSSFMFPKDKLRGKGVTAIFGQEQVLSFDLRYTLENSSPFPQVQTIAIPPDTQRQKVLYDSIIPTPQTLKKDPDGNWIATYVVEGRSTTTIHATGNAIISLGSGEPQPLSPELREIYLSTQVPWQVDDPQIKELAQKLKTPEAIYNFVVENLEYDYDKVESGGKRLGAKGALNNPENAICMEFTDLFIALSRAAGIPTRELNGFAFTQNPKLRPLSLKQDVLHSWPEYFNEEKGTWIPIDPTWENTTQGIDYFSRFDLNHFVFVIHGQSPTTPYPAGFYKTENTLGKDILITPREDDPQVDEELEIQLKVARSLFPLMPGELHLKLTNIGNAAIDNRKLIIVGSDPAILDTFETTVTEFLPYAELDLRLPLRRRNALTSIKGGVNVTLGDKQYETPIIVPPLAAVNLQAIFTLALGATLATSAIHSGRLLLSRRRR